EAVDAGRRDESDRALDRVPAVPLRGGAVLDALDALDFALDVDAAGVCLLDDLPGLPRAVGELQPGSVEEHRVPAVLDALGDDLPVGAVVQVQHDWHR